MWVKVKGGVCCSLPPCPAARGLLGCETEHRALKPEADPRVTALAPSERVLAPKGSQLLFSATRPSGHFEHCRAILVLS